MSNNEDEDFAAMFAESEKNKPKQGKRPRVGDMISGRVISVGKDAVFVDLGGKAEGQLDRGQVSDADGKLLVKVGDTIEARVVADAGGVLSLRTKVARGPQASAELQQAFELGLPVEGLVTEVVKGGVSVDVAGVRGFCPASQIDARFVDDLNVFVGQRLEFRITRYERANLVLSRRSLLEEVKAKLATETRKKLVDGARVHGTITRLQPFGAFVEIAPGVEGLVHISELGAGRRIHHPKEAVQVGQTVEATVVSVDHERRRLSLSLSASKDASVAEVGEHAPKAPQKLGTFGDLLAKKTKK